MRFIAQTLSGGSVRQRSVPSAASVKAFPSTVVFRADCYPRLLKPARWASSRVASCIRVEGHHELLGTHLALREQPVSDHRKRGVTLPQALGFPNQWRSARGPRVEQSGFHRNAVAARTAPLRPIDAEG
jgi:hypothetical protein